MKEEILIDNIKFWNDGNIIYCKIENEFDKHCGLSEIEAIFLAAIPKLSEGRLLPILIDFSEIDYFYSVKLFKLLSKNFTLEKLVLSKTFLVNTYGLKVLLFIYNFKFIVVKPNTIFKEYNLAIKDCFHNYKTFNKLRLK